MCGGGGGGYSSKLGSSFMISNSLGSKEILHDDLNKFAQWEAAWLMTFNVATCHSLRVMKHPFPKQVIHDYSLHNQVLENVSSAKYLGITVTDDLE